MREKVLVMSSRSRLGDGRLWLGAPLTENMEAEWIWQCGVLLRSGPSCACRSRDLKGQWAGLGCGYKVWLGIKTRGVMSTSHHEKGRHRLETACSVSSVSQDGTWEHREDRRQGYPRKKRSTKWTGAQLSEWSTSHQMLRLALTSHLQGCVSLTFYQRIKS